jgi:hypothetical protein
VLEIAVFGLASSLLSIPLTKLVLPFFLYLIPALIVLPVLINARRYFEKPKPCAIVFAIAVAVFSLLVIVATIESGIALGFYSPGAANDIPFIAVFCCTIAAVASYYQVLRRLTAKRPSTTPLCGLADSARS